MNAVARQLSELKLSLQELESAVQQPRDEVESLGQVLRCFPVVLARFYEIIRNVLSTQGISVDQPNEAFTEAHKRGWLKGELSLWLRLASDFQQLKLDSAHEARKRAVAQDVRACSYMLWETFDVLTARFRYQTQVQQVAKPATAAATQRFSIQSG